MKLSEYNEKREKQIVFNQKLMEAGVEFADIQSAYIDETVEVGKGTFIGPCVTLKGDTKIGENCEIRQNTYIDGGKIGDKTTVGPFAYIRPGTVIGSECRIGDFVEIKNSVIGNGTKAAHLTYIGDGDVGEKVNFGCGVVFANYDGQNKFRSTVEDGAFIGCNTNLVSPVTIGEHAYIAAGTTVRKDVEPYTLVASGANEIKVPNWAKKKGKVK